MVNVTPKLEDFARTMSKQRAWEVKHKITVILQARKRAESSSDRHIAYIASKSLAFQQRRWTPMDVTWCDQQTEGLKNSGLLLQQFYYYGNIYLIYSNNPWTYSNNPCLILRNTWICWVDEFFPNFPTEKNGHDGNLGPQKSGLQIGADILLIGNSMGPILLIILDVSMNHLTIVSPIFWWFHTVQLLNFDLISKAIVSCISHFMTTDLVQPCISISSWKHLVLIVKP